MVEAIVDVRECDFSGKDLVGQGGSGQGGAGSAHAKSLAKTGQRH